MVKGVNRLFLETQPTELVYIWQESHRDFLSIGSHYLTFSSISKVSISFCFVEIPNGFQDVMSEREVCC
jgi:hypothetical protein